MIFEEYRIKFGTTYETTTIQEFEDDIILLSIPVIGGHVSSARSSLQEEWIKERTRKINGIVQIWITQWKILTKSALEKIRKILKNEAKKFDEEEDFYKNRED
jgi:hypothetical protein